MSQFKYANGHQPQPQQIRWINDANGKDVGNDDEHYRVKSSSFRQQQEKTKPRRKKMMKKSTKQYHDNMRVGSNKSNNEHPKQCQQAFSPKGNIRKSNGNFDQQSIYMMEDKKIINSQVEEEFQLFFEGLKEEMKAIDDNASISEDEAYFFYVQSKKEEGIKENETIGSSGIMSEFGGEEYGSNSDDIDAEKFNKFYDELLREAERHGEDPSTLPDEADARELYRMAMNEYMEGTLPLPYSDDLVEIDENISSKPGNKGDGNNKPK